MKRKVFLATAVILGTLVLAGCAAGPNPTIGAVDAAGKTAGFWPGLWHGVISPVTFIISLFSDNVGVYDVYNNGNWYDFGFMLGASIVLGGGSHGVRRKPKTIAPGS